jgi:hypothetical protein
VKVDTKAVKEVIETSTHSGAASVETKKAEMGQNVDKQGETNVF